MSEDEIGQMRPENFYDEYGEKEWERLEANIHRKMEFESTVHYLKEYLPDSGKVLDAGGGAGRYTIWLAERGYEVVLLDLSEGQLRVAEEKVKERDLEDKVSFLKGEIRDLDFVSEEFDAVLCTGGPLSHIVDEEERKEAVIELKRVAKSKAPIFISVMSFFQVISNIMSLCPEEVVLLPEYLETGDYTEEMVQKHSLEPTFTECHFFRREEFEELLESCGLTVEKIVGLEGPISELVDIEKFEEESTEEDRKIVREMVEKTREDPVVAEISSHMMAVVRKA